MTQFKERSEEQDFVSAGLFNYPVLMAGDILLYQTDIVPIGDDQRQHLELAREHRRSASTDASARRSRFREAVYPEEGARIKNLQEPERLMSTTRGAPAGVVRMIDPPDEVRKKFKTAVTDSGHRGAPRSGGEAGRLEPDRDHGRRRPGARSPRSRRGSTARATARSRRASPRPSSSCSRRSRSATTSSARTRASCGGCSPQGADKAARRARPIARDDVRAHGLCSAVAGGRWILRRNPRAVRRRRCHSTSRDASPVAVFLVSAAALAGLAWVIGIATEARRRRGSAPR